MQAVDPQIKTVHLLVFPRTTSNTQFWQGTDQNDECKFDNKKKKKIDHLCASFFVWLLCEPIISPESWQAISRTSTLVVRTYVLEYIPYSE